MFHIKKNKCPPLPFIFGLFPTHAYIWTFMEKSFLLTALILVCFENYVYEQCNTAGTTGFLIILALSAALVNMSQLGNEYRTPRMSFASRTCGPDGGYP